VLKNEAEDGVIRDLAGERVECGEDFVAGGCAGLSGDEDGVGELGKHEGVGEDGGGAMDDDEAEFLAPRSKEAGHTLRGDEFGRAGRMSAGMDDGERGKAGDGMGAGEEGFVGEHFAETGVGGGGGVGSGPEVGVEIEDRRVVLRKDRSQAEGERRSAVGCVGC
jgi:hypothetical protein